MADNVSKTNEELLRKSEALKKLHEHNRDYLSLTLTIPLGNKALKNVHTNQWLFTDLPKEFDLANWTVIADALKSEVDRWEGYIKNRWYIEGVDISVDVNGKAEMKLTLNAFASSYGSYSEAYKSMQKAYTDAVNAATKSTTNANNSTAVANNNEVLNQNNIKQYNIPKKLTEIAESVCKGKKSEKDKAYALYEWMDSHVDYEGYYEHQKSEEQVINDGRGNCVDNSRVYRLLCLAVGIKCNFVKNTCTPVNHQYNRVYVDGKGVDVDCGRELASWGSNWGGSSSCGQETESSW